MKCYACGKLVRRICSLVIYPSFTRANQVIFQGHISRDCTAPNGGPLSSVGKVCYKCSQAGHISRDCPTNNAEIKVPPTVTTEPTSTTLIPDVEVPVEAPAVTTGAVNSTTTA